MVSAKQAMLQQYVEHPRHGPLPGILLLLTAGTGVIDAVSILALGRVFVANMTGNIVFIGFALSGAPGFSLTGSLVALGAFLLGAAGGGLFVSRFADHRGRLLRNGLLVELGLLLIALAAAAASDGVPAQLLVLGAAALALGVQNSVVRHLAVPDMTTTVLTMTLTGIAADLRHRDFATSSRRIAVVLAMLVGALVGGALVLRLGVDAGLIASVIVVACGTALATIASRGRPAWAEAPAP